MRKTFLLEKHIFRPTPVQDNGKDATSFPFCFLVIFVPVHILCVSSFSHPILLAGDSCEKKKKKEEHVWQLWAHVFSPSSDLGRWTGLEL